MIRFRRSGTEFVATLNGLPNNNCDFGVRFDLPPTGEKFYIRRKSLLVGLHLTTKVVAEPSENWHLNTTSELADEFLLLSRNPRYLDALLSDPKIVSEITKHDTAWGRFIEIDFDHGRFEVVYHADFWKTAERLRSVCETAVAFYDRLNSPTGN